MRLLLFSSQIMNALNYARAFGQIDDEFVVSVLVPNQSKKRYEEFFAQPDERLKSNVTLSPIFLKSPNESFRNFLNPRNLFHDFGAIVRTVRKYKPDAVIAMYVIHAYPLLLLKKFMKFNLFVMVSGGDLELHDNLIWKLTRKAAYSNSQVIFTVGHKLKEEIEKEGGSHVIVIPTGADPDYYTPNRQPELRRKYGFREDDFVALTLSQLIERKCIDDVLRAVASLTQRYANVKVIIAGDGPEKDKLIKLSTDQGLANSVLFAGSISDSTKRDFFNLVDVYVIASYQEGMPFSLMEAMSCGCICICTNVGDMPKLVEDSRNGFLVRPREPQQIADTIERIMSQPIEEQTIIRNRARQTILEKHDFVKWTKKMVEIIQSETQQ